MEPIKNMIEVIKKKPLAILGGAAVITFLLVKVIDIFLNWYVNLNTPNSVITYTASIGMFSPIIFLGIVVLLAKVCAKKYNTEQIVPDYYDNYTWRDIFKDRTFFVLFAILTYILWLIIQIVLIWISNLSENYAIASMANTPVIVTLGVAAVLSMKLALVIQNIVLAWFMRTELGNKVISKVVFGMGVLTAIVMSGIDALWSDPNSSMEEVVQDYVLGELIPIDVWTTAFALITIFLWYKVKNCSWCDGKAVKRGFWIAVISFIISLTPLATGIQFVWIFVSVAIRSLFEVLRL